MVHLNLKKHVIVMVPLKQGGMEARVLKRQQSDHKLYDRIESRYETELRKHKRLTS